MPVLLTVLPTTHAHALAVILTIIIPGTGAIAPARPTAAAGAISRVIPGITIIIAAAAGTHTHTGCRRTTKRRNGDCNQQTLSNT
jgi:hypothetical protein